MKDFVQVWCEQVKDLIRILLGPFINMSAS
jgi:hypothetical protein